MGVITRGVKNAFRNTIRTFSIVFILGLSIGLALSMLLARGAVESKIESVKASIGNTITVSPAGMRGFEGGGEPLTQTQVPKIETLEHVTQVISSVSDRLDSETSSLESSIEAGSLGQRFSQSAAPKESTTGEVRSFTPPITILGTTEPTNLATTQGGGTFNLTSGEVFDANTTEDVSLVGQGLATKNNLAVGSTFTANDKTIKVAGIFDAGNNFSNNLVIMPIGKVQEMTNRIGEVTSVTVIIDSLTNLDSATTAIKTTLGDSVDVTNGAEQAKTVVEPLENIKGISTISLIGSIVAGAVIILLTMIMIVRERRREIGVLKAIGATNTVVMTQFTIESLTLTLMGAFVGLGIGIYGSSPITNLLVQNSTSTQTATRQPGMGRMMQVAGQSVMNIRNIETSVGWDIILYGFLAAVAIAVIGSAIPAWLISKVRPAEVMRAE